MTREPVPTTWSGARLLSAVIGLVVTLALAGCGSSGGGEAVTTTAPTVPLRLTVHALGGGVTWDDVGVDACAVGTVRVTVADGTGATLAVEDVEPPTGVYENRFADCTTDPAVVSVPAAEVYRVTVAGAGPLGAEWSAEGEFNPDELESGLLVTARSPLPSDLTVA